MDTTIGTGFGASAANHRSPIPTAGSAAAASSNIDAVFEEENKEVSVDSFLQLMIAQLKNQDFMNPMDDTQYVTQLAQFATMQQMQDLAYYSKSNYVMSLVGKDVTVAKLGVGGEVEKQTGPIEKISFYQDKYYIHVGGKSYTLNQLMEVNGKSVSDVASDKIDVSNQSIVVGAVTDTTAQVSWPPASEDETLENKLRYTIYYSEDRNMDTLEDVKDGTIFGSRNRVGLTEDIITGLEPDTVYYVNVIVTDHNGKESLYSKSIIKTEEEEDRAQQPTPVEDPTDVAEVQARQEQAKDIQQPVLASDSPVLKQDTNPVEPTPEPTTQEVVAATEVQQPVVPTSENE